MIICKRLAPPDDNLQEAGNNNNDKEEEKKEEEEEEKEEKKEEKEEKEKKFLRTGSRADQLKVVQEVLPDLISEQNRITIPVSLFLSGWWWTKASSYALELFFKRAPTCSDLGWQPSTFFEQLDRKIELN